MTELKRTPLYDRHVARGARMVSFAGFEMPVSYEGVLAEHAAVRERVGIFDVSHMGEFVVTGPQTWPWLNSVVTNDVEKLSRGRVLYTVMCRDDGTTVDDLLVMRLHDDRALVVVNAANIEKDFEHMSGMVAGDVAIEDQSNAWALIAVQGPRSRELLSDCPRLRPIHESLSEMAYYRQLAFDTGEGVTVVSRTGYTGELGYELFVPPSSAPALWDELLQRGRDAGVAPVGLAARDTLRFEAAFCLYGHELDDATTPLEAGLGWVVKLRKGDFRGREALARQKEGGLERRLVGLELDGRNIARQGYEVVCDGRRAGEITSGTFSPTLQKSLALAFVRVAALESGAGLAVRVRNKQVAAARVDIPFYPSRAAKS